MIHSMFSCTIEKVRDSVVFGNSAVSRRGLLVKLRHLETGDVQEFYLAGRRDPCAIEQHMRTLTEGQMLQWFTKRERKPKSK